MCEEIEFHIGDIVSRRGDGDLWEVTKGCIGFDVVYVRCIKESPSGDDGESWCKIGDEEIFLSDRLDMESVATPSADPCA